MQAPDTSTANANEVAKGLIVRLAPMLMRQGLQVVAQRNGFVEVRNPSGNRTTDPLGRALNPGMKQSIALGDRDGVLWWHWVWSGVTRDAPPEYEPMCAADDLDEVARRLAVVLAVAGS
ncbi:MAG: hypothetical protein JWR24_5123 [Actinoallomurus sp.]|nr:hypothetical protein [Actinoallomurus sp.]